MRRIQDQTGDLTTTIEEAAKGIRVLKAFGRSRESFEGYDAQPTAEGVSSATTRTVVTSSLAILALDFVLTALMFTGGNAR